jgi:tetratricopeptide (TPR) repeat protein
LGAFVYYDLDKAFKAYRSGNVPGSVMSQETIPEDPIVNSKAYKDYEEYRKLSREITEVISAEKKVSEEKIKELKYLNPYFWEAYKISGDYYFQQKQYKRAVIDYKQAKRREVTTLPDEEYLEKMITKSCRRL